VLPGAADFEVGRRPEGIIEVHGCPVPNQLRESWLAPKGQRSVAWGESPRLA
jgi:hypothetical protein